MIYNQILSVSIHVQSSFVHRVCNSFRAIGGKNENKEKWEQKQTNVKRIGFVTINIGQMYTVRISGDKRNDDTKGDVSYNEMELL